MRKMGGLHRIRGRGVYRMREELYKMRRREEEGAQKDGGG
jgi:hypothetical protein